MWYVAAVPRVLIDLRMVEDHLHGIARYALELAARLPRLAPDWRFEALTGPAGLPSDLGALQPWIPLRRCPAPFLSLFEQPALAAALMASGCDLFHATSFSLPALWTGRLVATLHDANHIALKEEYGATRRAYYQMVVEPRARRADALITVSQFSRDELARHLHLDPERLQVIPNGVSQQFTTGTTAVDIQAVRARYRLPARYFAVVGNLKPFKNLEVLARAAPQLPVPIALLAGEGAKEKYGFPASTIELSTLDDAMLPAFYAGASALLLPSRYEGFGLPALEAMASGCPVIASNATSLPEVVGGAGLLVEPEDVPGWIDAARKLLDDAALRARLIDAGRERAARYTWDEVAKQTLAVYARALDRA